MGSVNPDVDAAKKRSQVVKWLNTLFPDFNLPLHASEEELRAQMSDGVLLCAIPNRKNLGSIQSQRGVFISTEQRLYNLKRFLSAMDEMGLPRFNTSDLEQGSMSAVVDCLLSLRDHMSSGIGEDGLYDATKYGSQPRKKWNLSEGDRVVPMDVSQGNYRGSEPSSPLSGRSTSESKSQNVLRNPTMPEPSTAMLHPVGGHKFPEVFQLQQGCYSDLPAAKISEMMKSNSLDNAPTQSLLSVVNGILDESIERKNGEIPHRVACLLRKVVQEIERRISTQADHIRSQNNLIKAREEKYQSRIRVLETLASGTSEETQIVSNQLQKIKIEKKKIEESKKNGDQDMDRLIREKENSDHMISELKQELENVKKSYKNQSQHFGRNSNNLDRLIREKENSDHMISELKQELENVKKSYKNQSQHFGGNSSDMDRLIREKENSDHMISELKQELENVKKSYKNQSQQFERNSNEKLMREKEESDHMISELKQELENVKKSYENRCQQLERDSNEIKTQLEKRIKEAESLLVESRRRMKELEAFSESKFQNWNKKEHVLQNFIGSQLQSVKNMRVSSESIKQEVIRTENEWREEMTSLGVKLKVLVDAAENYHTVLAENRKLYNDVLELKGNIRVYCRVRPFIPGQNAKSTTVDYIGDNGEVLVVNPSKQGKDGRRMFKFNKAFGPASTQEQVYLDIQPLVRSVLDGYNVCIFAYGQTGSGKTYTMSGPNSPTKENWGVNYRALDDLFNISCSRRNTFLYEIGVQMVEIYNEQVRDLLTTNSAQRRFGILNSSQPNGLAVPDASMLPVNSTSDVMELMQFGQSNRAMCSTALNERSSRSHSIVTIHVRSTDLKTRSSSHGSLHLVDLAGSERVDRSEVTGDRLKEAQHINKSLSALGDVIFALAQKSKHVPYRNSKLTQVLQSSLGGHAKTLMFVQVNPEVTSYSETISTLKFAERVSGVELGAARSNKEGKDVKDLMEQVASLKDTIARKDEEIEELQLIKDLRAASPSESNSLRHSLSSPGLSLSSEERGQRLTGGMVGRYTEKVASDPENSSEFSDKHSENGSQQSADDIRHRKENGNADSDDRLSDISDGGHSMGAETDSSTAESNFSEASKKSATTKEKMPRISSLMPKPLPQRTKPTMSVRPKLKDALKSTDVKKSTSSQPIASSPRIFKR